MNAIKAVKPRRAKKPLNRATTEDQAPETMTRKAFLKEVQNLLSHYPRDEDLKVWDIDTPYGPVLVGNPDTPSGSDELYYIPIRFMGTHEQFMEFWNANGRFEKCSPNGKWNILEKNPRKALWLLRYRLRFTRPQIPLPHPANCSWPKSNPEPPKRKSKRSTATLKPPLLPTAKA